MTFAAICLSIVTVIGIWIIGLLCTGAPEAPEWMDDD